MFPLQSLRRRVPYCQEAITELCGISLRGESDGIRRAPSFCSTARPNLKLFRAEKAWSQEQLAERASIQRSYLADLERGRRNFISGTHEGRPRFESFGLKDGLRKDVESLGRGCPYD
jgi:hypothetical protein